MLVLMKLSGINLLTRYMLRVAMLCVSILKVIGCDSDAVPINDKLVSKCSIVCSTLVYI
jgi:hypothetical protein